MGVIWRIQAFTQELHAAMASDYYASARVRREEPAAEERNCLAAAA
jgi:hypothetical protein